MEKVDIIWPLYFETKNSIFFKNLKTLLECEHQVRVIAIIHESDTETEKILNNYEIYPVKTSLETRASRINKGISLLSHKHFIILHPRSYFYTDMIADVLASKGWGGFTHQFDMQHYILTFASWYSNIIRGRIFSIIYLDHIIYGQSSFLKDYQIPDVAIFEDTYLSYYLRKKSKAIILPRKAITSAIRFKKNGLIKQAIKNQILKIKFFLKRDLSLMNKSYEKDINLNNRY